MDDVNWNGAKNYGLGKTYASRDEAFRDTNYATAFWRCETDHQYGWRKTKEFLEVLTLGGILLWAVYLLFSLLLR